MLHSVKSATQELPEQIVENYHKAEDSDDSGDELELAKDPAFFKQSIINKDFALIEEETGLPVKSVEDRTISVSMKLEDVKGSPENMEFVGEIKNNNLEVINEKEENPEENKESKIEKENEMDANDFFEKQWIQNEKEEIKKDEEIPKKFAEEEEPKSLEQPPKLMEEPPKLMEEPAKLMEEPAKLMEEPPKLMEEPTKNKKIESNDENIENQNEKIESEQNIESQRQNLENMRQNTAKMETSLEKMEQKNEILEDQIERLEENTKQQIEAIEHHEKKHVAFDNPIIKESVKENTPDVERTSTNFEEKKNDAVGIRKNDELKSNNEQKENNEQKTINEQTFGEHYSRSGELKYPQNQKLETRKKCFFCC